MHGPTALEMWVDPWESPSLANPKFDSLAFHCSSKRMFEDLKSKIIYDNHENTKEKKTSHDANQGAGHMGIELN